jgi:hypothetical protein
MLSTGKKPTNLHTIVAQFSEKGEEEFLTMRVFENIFIYNLPVWFMCKKFH